MSKTEHTPGPSKLARETAAKLHGVPDDRAAQVIQAALDRVAAPDLLAAAEYMDLALSFNSTKRVEPARDALRTAIAKTKGE